MDEIYLHQGGKFTKVTSFNLTSGKLTGQPLLATGTSTVIVAGDGTQLVRFNNNPINGYATYTVVAVA